MLVSQCNIPLRSFVTIWTRPITYELSPLILSAKDLTNEASKDALRAFRLSSHIIDFRQPSTDVRNLANDSVVLNLSRKK
ncbi:unnamed protein product [Heligmosomoides polygyrus]|uniref:Uncharacterized protein n=1 Tax=Heligmosomoides polygyrus TaxID=6339 RepID=A0A3P8CT56_HELPZ|nr:unnamed protein product [Heligmosomoides polygyrus]